ncbi:MAG TPA: GAF domain-containing protein [Anaerolineales bacterium]|nr:GAF domain-containing protein [Anaerolineales bacterium]
MSARDSTRERARASLELLVSISRELAAQLDLRRLLQSILLLTLENVGALSGSILVLNEEGAPTEGALAYGGRVHDHTAEQLADTMERGLAGWVVKRRQAALVPSTLEDPRWLRRPGERRGVSRSAISVPLIAHERVVGVLTLVHPKAGSLTQDHLALLTAISDQAGIAVENARLYAAEQKRRQLAATLQEIARVISATLDPAQVFPQVLRQLERVVAFDSASIFVLEEDRLRLVAARGFADNESLVGLTIPVSQDNPTGRVLAARQPIVIGNAQEEPGWMADPPLPEESRLIRGWIGAPLLVRERAVGVLNTDSHQLDAYGPSEAEVVFAFAHQAATAVANAQLFAESQRQMRAMVALAETARVITASLDVDEVLQRILTQTTSSLEVESASLALVEESSGDLLFQVAGGRMAKAVVGVRLGKGQGIAGWVVENGEPLLIPNVRADPRFYPQVDLQIGFETRSLICAPIRVRDRTIGVLEAINPLHGEFQSHHVDLLTGIAGLAGTAISHARLFAETQAAHQRYAGLFEDSVDPILITDLQGKIGDANRRAQVFIGRRRKWLVGAPVSKLMAEEPDHEAARSFQLRPSQTTSYQAKAVHADGRLLPVEVHVKRIDLEGQPTLQWILRDISERLALDELREDLISMIFHDLRSPLGNIISSLDVMQTSLPQMDENLPVVLSVAIRSSRRLSRLVDSLLDLGRLEAGKAVLEKNPCSIASLLEEALEEVRPVAEAKGHTLVLEAIPPDLPTLEFDLDMIRRVIINLLENAVKYTRGGGSITLFARGEERSICVGVRDTGPGIAQPDQKLIFDKFARLKRAGRPKGLGLGLAFCRLAVDAHGGRIWVESEVDKGSTFFFTLPL